jgi:uncharacterized protein (TIGR01777 family)
MRKIIIFGGSGFIGKHLIKELGNNYEYIIPTRNPREIEGKFPENCQVIKLDIIDYKSLIPFFDQADGIVNLAGENVSGKWTAKKKKAIEYSRINIDRLIVKVFLASNHNIHFIIQGSGMGVYGLSRNKIEIDESSQLGRHGFLTKVGKAHERALSSLENKTRVIHIRTGLVLDGNEGALPQMADAFHRNLGGTMGSGKQWNSWIHIKDEVRAIKFLIENESSRGAYNLTAPNAVRQKEFAKLLGKALNKPSYLKKPAFLLRLMLRGMANELLLKGLNIKPVRLLEEGFTFRFNTLEEALSDIYRNTEISKVEKR